MKRSILTSITAAALLGTSLLVSAADMPFEKQIKARKAQMQLYSFNIGVLSAMAKGEAEYDAEAAKVAADNLQAVAHLNGSMIWPQGSGNDNAEIGDKTRALPEIWSTYPKIAEAGKTFKAATVELAKVAGDGLDAMKDKLGGAGKGCKGCHDDYRAKKKM